MGENQKPCHSCDSDSPLSQISTATENTPVWKTRTIFRFKPGMKAVLLNQVATDNPEGGASSSKGWEVPVQKLIKQGGTRWELLNTRVARENVRQWVEDWNKRNREQEKSTGAVEEEEEDDKLCRELYESWAVKKLERQEGCDKKKLEQEKKKTGLDIRQKAVEGLKERNRDDEKESEDAGQKATPVKRRKQDVLEYLRESKGLEERRISIRERELDMQAEKQKSEIQLQQQQMQLMQQMLQQLKDKN